MILCLPTIPSPPDPRKQHVLLFHHPVHHHTTSGLPPQPRCHPNDFESFQFHTAPPTFPTKTSLPPHFLFNLPCLRNYQFQDLLLLQLVKSSHVSKVWIWNNYCLMDNLTWLFILSFLTNWSLDLQFLFKQVGMNILINQVFSSSDLHLYINFSNLKEYPYHLHSYADEYFVC